jgi:hypothetical protein
MTQRSPLIAALAAAAAAGLALGAACGLASCSSSEPKRARAPENLVVRDVPPPLRGTIGSIVTFERDQTVLVSGFGFVVGLNGTGGGPYDERIAGSMEQELARQGVSQSAPSFEGTPFEGLSPRQVLERKDVAIVLVQAAIPPGAPIGSTFDVLVRSMPNSGTSSLEGGMLYTSDLRLGPASVLGGQQPKIIGKAKGSVFINPFAEPGKEANGVSQLTGRILAGGEVTDPLKIWMLLDRPSSSRASTIVSVINSRFPQGDEPDKTARGRDERVIELRVPSAYQDRAGEFLKVVQGLQLDNRFPDDIAFRYVEDMKKETWLADQLAYCLVAVGDPAKKFLHDLYDYPEIVPRMAALRAGAALGDVQAMPALIELALRGRPGDRADAIEMLASLDGGPRVDEALLTLLADPELDVRAAAMEGLASRAEKVEAIRLLRQWEGRPGLTYAQAQRAAREAVKGRLSGQTIQGIQRTSIGDDPENPKFVVDIVPVGEPLIYITQSGVPRIVLFGENLRLRRPMTVAAWSDRLLMAADTETDSIRVRYEGPPRRSPTGGEVPGRVVTATLSDDVLELIRFMARRPSDLDARPGLSLTYSEVVGGLWEIQEQGGLDAAIATQRDRLLAQLLKAAQESRPPDRPETDQPVEDPVATDPMAPKVAPEDVSPPVEEGGSMVVPLRERPTKKSIPSAGE